jgi:Flp pilus assembly protein TadG
MVEAALIFPLMIGLFLGVSEFCEAFTASRRLEIAAFTAADLVARVPTVASADLNALKPLIDETVRPFPVDTLGLVITSVVADKDNALKVAWSYAQGPGVSAYTTGSTITIPSGLTLPETSIIFAEVHYTFRSTLSSMLPGNVPMQAAGYQRPRVAIQVAKTD